MVTLRELGFQNSTLQKLGFYRGMGKFDNETPLIDDQRPGRDLPKKNLFFTPSLMALIEPVDNTALMSLGKW